MLILPDGMDEKLLEAQQTLYGDADPKLKILVRQAVRPTGWTNLGLTDQISALAYGDDILYVGTLNHGIFTYNRLSWDNFGVDGDYSYIVNSLFYNATNHALYAGKQGHGIYTFVPATGEWLWIGPAGGHDIDFITNPAGSTGYATNGAGWIWRYTTGWEYITGDFPEYYIHDIEYDATHNKLYVGTWNFYGSGGGVWVWNNSNSWSNTGGGLSAYSIRCLYYDSVDGVLYAGTYYHGVWAYSGGTWTDIGVGGDIAGYDVYCLTGDPSRGRLFAGCLDWEADVSTGVWMYDGVGWEDCGGLSGSDIYYLAYDADHDILYVATNTNVWGYVPPLPDVHREPYWEAQ